MMSHWLGKLRLLLDAYPDIHILVNAPTPDAIGKFTA